MCFILRLLEATPNMDVVKLDIKYEGNIIM